MNGWRGRMTALFVLAVALAAVPGRGRAQIVQETRLLREAAALESRGDLAGAETVLRGLLAVNPASSGGLFALERVLRAEGALERVLPAVDSFLVREPDDAGARALKLRVLVDLDSVAGVEAEGRRWLALQPDSEVSYREVARAYREALGDERALEVLLRGRQALHREDAFALDVGDLLLALRRGDEAVEAWIGAVSRSGRGAASIRRRLEAEPSQVAREVERGLVTELWGAPDGARREAAVLTAIEFGMEGEARRLAAEVEETLADPDAARSFLGEVARRARAARMEELASWAYEHLAAQSASTADRRRYARRRVEAALGVGDTLAALEAQRQVVETLTPGSADRRRAEVLEIRLEGVVEGAARLKGRVLEFRERFPDAPENDVLTAEAAKALLASGDAEGAAEVLEGVEGPRSGLERGMFLLAAGEVHLGRRELLRAVPGLPPAEGTRVVQLAGLLGRLSPSAGALLARAAVLEHGGSGGEGAALLVEGAPLLEGAEASALLAHAGRMARRAGAEDSARSAWRTLLTDYPEAPERPAAALSLALALTEEGAGGEPGPAGQGKDGETQAFRDEAVRLLESLILQAPDAAVAPEARRLLERLTGGGR
ncbi:MAG: hypothetical protein ACE5GJ_06305 [Gemmatimonadota bacterium]